MKILFLLRKRIVPWNPCESYSGGSHFSSGLFNSANFVNKMLQAKGMDSHLLQVIDNNDIDREVTKLKPNIVIVEAFWVVPEKFEVLTRLHPNVTWIIRNHSEIPFLSTEGIGIDWSLKYIKYPKVYLACNSLHSFSDFQFLAGKLKNKVIYLPNYYPINVFETNQSNSDENHINICCFGAIRPLKNPLLQAVAAMRFADKIGKKLKYHINSVRVENSGESTLKSIRTLFANMPQHELVEHQWLTHGEFVKLCRTMDFGLQVSFTETFNIVIADLVNANVPVVVSDEISWIVADCFAEENSSEEIAKQMKKVWNQRSWSCLKNKYKLWAYSKDSQKIWLDKIADFKKCP